LPGVVSLSLQPSLLNLTIDRRLVHIIGDTTYIPISDHLPYKTPTPLVHTMLQNTLSSTLDMVSLPPLAIKEERIKHQRNNFNIPSPSNFRLLSKWINQYNFKYIIINRSHHIAVKKILWTENPFSCWKIGLRMKCINTNKYQDLIIGEQVARLDSRGSGWQTENLLIGLEYYIEFILYTAIYKVKERWDLGSIMMGIYELLL